MIRSLRRFLLVSLVISITIASSITAMGNYLLDKRVIQPYLDDQLIKTADFIKILDEIKSAQVCSQEKINQLAEAAIHSAHHSLFFQVWSQNGTLLFHSPAPIAVALYELPNGFSDIILNNTYWRIYATVQPSTHSKIMIAEKYDRRNKLAVDITRNNGYILLITYPIFVILIWIIVALALYSITRVTNEISNRASSHLDPVDPTHIPIEIKPLVTALNHLFLRLKSEFERRKRFASDAAHELRTPLAALKMQAQVALRADNEKDREEALLKVIQSVDRSSHLVTQLLHLSRVSQAEAEQTIAPVDLHKLAVDVIAEIAPIALRKKIDIELVPPSTACIVQGNEIALSILIRNIVDNAIRYTPRQGSIKIELLVKPDSITLRTIDTGPGIPEDLRERVFERFYRIVGTTAAGSGLGLAIVQQIAEMHHAKIALNTPPNEPGLQFDVIFPVTSTLG